MKSFEERYKESQGIYFKDIPEMEKDIISWHKKIENHKIKINEDICLNAYVSGDKMDTLTASQISNASKNGEINIVMKYYAAETGRSTTTGINIQGLKKGSAGRKSIEPHKGNIFLKVDSKTIEPRVLAWLSNEEKLLNIFNKKGDIYESFGKTLGIGREQGKTAFLSSMYGQGKNGIMSLFKEFGIEITEEKAKKIRNTFVSEYQKITGGFKKQNGLWQKSFDCVLKNSCLKLPSGRFIVYKPKKAGTDKWNNTKWANIEERGETNLWYGRTVNNLVQGTARDVFFWQVSLMVKALDGIADICWTVHDDAVFECEEKNKDIVKKVLTKCSSMSPAWCPHKELFVGSVTSGYSFNDL